MSTSSSRSSSKRFHTRFASFIITCVITCTPRWLNVVSAQVGFGTYQPDLTMAPAQVTGNCIGNEHFLISVLWVVLSAFVEHGSFAAFAATLNCLSVVCVFFFRQSLRSADCFLFLRYVSAPLVSLPISAENSSKMFTSPLVSATLAVSFSELHSYWQQLADTNSLFPPPSASLFSSLSSFFSLFPPLMMFLFRRADVWESFA